MKTLVLALLIPLLASCSASHFINEQQMPGYISENTSLEGVRSVSLSPSWLYKSDNMLLGAYWNENMGDNLTLTATIPIITQFSRDPLKITADDQVILLKPTGSYYGTFETMDFGNSGTVFRTKQEYKINKTTLQEILNSDRVILRADLSDSYIEGQLLPVTESQSQYPEMMALTHLNEFLNKIEKE